MNFFTLPAHPIPLFPKGRFILFSTANQPVSGLISHPFAGFSHFSVHGSHPSSSLPSTALGSVVGPVNVWWVWFAHAVGRDKPTWHPPQAAYKREEQLVGKVVTMFTKPTFRLGNIPSRMKYGRAVGDSRVDSPSPVRRRLYSLVSLSDLSIELDLYDVVRSVCFMPLVGEAFFWKQFRPLWVMQTCQNWFPYYLLSLWVNYIQTRNISSADSLAYESR